MYNLTILFEIKELIFLSVKILDFLLTNKTLLPFCDY